MRSKVRRIGLARTGSVQVLVGGLVLFLSGTMFGGYVVWSHLKGRPAEQSDLGGQVNAVTQTAGQEGQLTNEIPQAHAFGSKSGLITNLKPASPSAAPPSAASPAAMAPSSKWAPIVSPSDIKPATAHPVGSKSFMPIMPSDFKGMNTTKGGGKSSGASLPAPPPMLFGTKSAPVFAPMDLDSNKARYRVASPATNLPAPVSKALAPQTANPNQVNSNQAAPVWRQPTKASSPNPFSK